MRKAPTKKEAKKAKMNLMQKVYLRYRIIQFTLPAYPCIFIRKENKGVFLDGEEIKFGINHLKDYVFNDFTKKEYPMYISNNQTIANYLTSEDIVTRQLGIALLQVDENKIKNERDLQKVCDSII